MKKILTLGLFFLSTLVFSRCAGRSLTHGTTAEWFDGSVEEAFILAEKRNVPVFLYWGAKWCPPCHQLKQDVFNRPRFGELMQKVVPVYLDGDTDAAQLWAERLEVHGYPTLLLLSPRKEERLRLSTLVSLPEFEEAFIHALTAKGSFKDLLSRAAAGNATDAEWKMLAFMNWSQAKGLDVNDPSILDLRKNLADKVPAKLKREKAMLAAAILVAAADPKSPPRWAESVRGESQKYLNAMLENFDTILATRGVILYSAKEVIEFVYPKDGKARDALEGRWLLAAKLIGNAKDISREVRLWAIFPELQIYQINHPKQPVPADLADEVKKRVQEVTQNVPRGEKEAILSGAAHLLRLTGATEQARAMLREEAKVSDTPWYYEGALARLEEEERQSDRALYWSERARKSAEGRATRVQWLVQDLQISLKFTGDNKDRVMDIVDKLYTLMFMLKDGFLGRNHKYVQQLEKPLSDELAKYELLKSRLMGYANKCAQLVEENQAHCKAHFKAVLGETAKAS